jgi:hypothetical protein
MTWSSWWGHASWCGALEQLVATIARAARATPVVVLLFMTERIRRRGCPVVAADTLAVWDHSVSPPLRGAMSPNSTPQPDSSIGNSPRPRPVAADPGSCYLRLVETGCIFSRRRAEG